MNPANKFLIFFGLLDLFYGYPLNFGPIIHPQFFFLYTENFDSVNWYQSNPVENYEKRCSCASQENSNKT